MNPLSAEIEGLLAKGRELAAGGVPLATVSLQDWLGQRGRLFAELNRIGAQFGDVDRKLMGSLIDEIRELDATIMPKVEAEMRRVGEELAGVQKLKTFLAGGVKPEQRSFLRRAL